MVEKLLMESLEKNKSELLAAIKDVVPGSNEFNESDIGFICSMEIIDIDTIDSLRSDYRLKIRVLVDGEWYNILNWFTYDYNHNQLVLTNNYITSCNFQE